MNVEKVLLILENNRLFEQVRQSVFEPGQNFEIDFTESISNAKVFLQEKDYDLVISGYYFFDGTCFDFMDLLRQIPFILLIPEENEDIAISVLKNGAFNYLIQDQENKYLELLGLLTEKALTLNNQRKKNRLLANAVEKANDSIFIVNQKDEIVFINQAFTQNYRWDEKSILDHSVCQIWPEDQWRLCKKKLEEFPQGFSSYEETHLTRDGMELPVLISSSRVLYPHETFMIFASANISSMKESQRRLEKLLEKIKNSEQYLSKILNRLDLGVMLTNRQEEILFVNDKFRLFFQAKNHDFEGKNWQEFFDSDSAFLVKNAKNSETVKIVLGQKNKRQIFLSVTKMDIENQSQKVYFFYDQTEVIHLQNRIDSQNQFMNMIGKSDAIRRVFQLIESIAGGDWTVLIQGETGTGKELVAKAIHHYSRRKNQPFIIVNLNSLNETLIYSQLFGHKKGAFTGANFDHKGFLETAEGGTLFLDEIGDIPESVQIALLRVFENKEYIKLGESVPRKSNVRILVATHKDLKKMSEEGLFRKDLYYRIQIARVMLPPLRNRLEDIPLLAGSFLSQSAEINHKNVTQISQDALRIMMKYNWPGNVRELKNAVEYAVISTQSNKIESADLPPEISGQSQPELSSDYPEKLEIQKALVESNGQKNQAAKKLGFSRATFYRKLKKYKIVSLMIH